jgi:adenylate kinase family enzyme
LNGGLVDAYIIHQTRPRGGFCLSASWGHKKWSNSMKKVAVFGKPGSGKSTLSNNLALITGLALYALDSIVFKPNGERVDREIFNQQHEYMLSTDCWIIDGLGPLDAFYKRLDTADTLIYVDLPYSVSYWLVTKRLLKGLMVKPKGWPTGCSILKGSWQSYKTLRLCPQFWNENFKQQLVKKSANKTLHIIRSTSELNHFIEKQISR